ncbi:MAG: MurR/RpiR family transcriptional regulator [Culicoidibacterales bacterium]
MYDFYSNLQKCIEQKNDYAFTDAIIALYILQHINQIADLSIEQLASFCHTSPATISRFCQRVNKSNFKQLKDDCRHYIAFINKEVAFVAQSADRITLSNYFQTLHLALAQTQDLINDDALKMAVGMIKRAKTIYFFGSSFSNIIAKNAHDKFTRLQQSCRCFSNLGDQIIAAKSMDSDDIGLIISFSGMTPRMNKIQQILTRHNNICLLITSKQANYPPNIIPLYVSPQKEETFESPIIEEQTMNALINCLYIEFVRTYFDNMKKS